MNDLTAQLLLASDWLDPVLLGVHRLASDARSIVGVLLAVLTAVAALWLMARLADRERRPSLAQFPSLLFLSLCRAHGLRWSQAWALWQIARKRGLTEPACVFVEPDVLRVKPDSRLTPAQARQAAELAVCLFGRLALEPAQAGRLSDDRGARL
jgi:hypothetical protein